MRQANRTTSTFGVACLGLLGCASTGGLVTAFYAHAVQSIEPMAVTVIAETFPSYRMAATPATYAAVIPSPDDDSELFSPRPFYPLSPVTAEPETAAFTTASLSMQPEAKPTSDKAPADDAVTEKSAAEKTAAEKTAADKPTPDKAAAEKSPVDKALTDKPAAVKVANAKPELSAAASPHANAVSHRRPGSVLNDAQIASIKTRLKLTPQQEQMWPAVEAALRNIVYSRTADARFGASQSGTHAMAYIDPNSDEVRQLKYAALPLIFQLNDEQRREVKSMVHVMGLEGVASQF